MLGQYGFLARVFDVLKTNKISVDVVATSEVSVSLTLDPAKFWFRDLYQEELDRLQAALDSIAHVQVNIPSSLPFEFRCQHVLCVR